MHFNANLPLILYIFLILWLQISVSSQLSNSSVILWYIRCNNVLFPGEFCLKWLLVYFGQESVQHFSEVCSRPNNSRLPGEIGKRVIDKVERSGSNWGWGPRPGKQCHLLITHPVCCVKLQLYVSVGLSHISGISFPSHHVCLSSCRWFLSDTRFTQQSGAYCKYCNAGLLLT